TFTAPLATLMRSSAYWLLGKLNVLWLLSELAHVLTRLVGFASLNVVSALACAAAMPATQPRTEVRVWVALRVLAAGSAPRATERTAGRARSGSLMAWSWSIACTSAGRPS